MRICGKKFNHTPTHAMKMNRLNLRHRKSAHSMGRNRILAGSAALLAAILPLGPKASAATYYWDADGMAAGNNVSGAGLGNLGGGPFIWETSAGRWWDGNATDAAWVNGSDTAVFTGTAGTVTLGVPITAGGLVFNVGGYTIAGGGNTLTLGGTTLPTVRVTNAATLATITSDVVLAANAVFGGAGNLTFSTGVISGAGFGFTKVGTGTLTLAGANTFDGPVALRSGTTAISAADNLGDGSATNKLTLAGGTLQAGGTFSLGANRGPIIGLGDGVLDVTGANNLTVNGTLSADVALTGGVILTKTGAGTLTLSGTNSAASINTVVNGGVLSIADNTNLGSGRVTLSGGTLQSTGSSTLTGGINLGTAGGTIKVDPAQTLILGALTTGPGSLTKTGTGTLRINIASTYAGATTVSEGILQAGIAASLPAGTNLTVASGATFDINALAVTVSSLSGSGTINNSSGTTNILTLGNFAGSQDTTFSGTFNSATAANMTLVKTAGGTLTIATPTANTGTNTGTWTLNAGTVNIDYTVNGSATGNMLTSRAMLLQGGTLQVTGRSGATVAQTLGAITVGVRGGQIIMVPSGGTSTTLTLGTLAHPTTAGASLLINAPATTFMTTSTAGNTGTGIFGGRYVFTDGTNYNWATNTGANTNTIGYSGYSALLLTAGTDASNSTLTGSATLTGSRTTNTLKLLTSGSGQSLDLDGNLLTLTAGGFLFAGADSYTLTGGTLASNTATNSDLIVHQYGTGTLTIDSSIVNGTGASTLTKVGTGTLVLGSANTFTGAIFINGGTLSVSDNNQLGNAGAATAITINDGATFQTTADLTIAGSGAASHTFSLTGGNATFDIADATTLTLAGVVSGAGGLTLNNTGTLRLNAAATLTGPVFVGAGATLQGGVTAFINAAAGGNLNVASGGVVNMNDFTLTVGGIAGAGSINNNGGTAARILTVGGNNQNTTFSGVLSATTSTFLALTKNGSGTLTLTNQNTYTGATLLNYGSIKFGTNNALANTAITIMNAAANGIIPAVLDLDGYNWTSAAITLYGTTSTAVSQAAINIGAGGVLTLGGNVTLTVNATAANGFQPAFITGGTIDLSATRTFAIADSINAAADLTVTSVISSTAGTFGITKTGAGTLLLTGANTYTGTTTVNGAGGVLALGGAGTIGVGTNTLTMTAGTLDLNGTNQAVGAFSGAAAGSVRNSAAGTLSTLTVGNGTLITSSLGYVGTLIDGGGTLAVVKNGAGILTLTGANTYTGGTQVNEGILVFGNTSAQPAAGTTQVASISALGLGVGGGGFYGVAEVDALFANTLANVNLAAGAGVGIDTTAGDYDYTTSQAAARGLVKLGTNVLTLSGTNTYTGGTLIAAGTLAISSNANLGDTSGGLSMLTGTTLRVTGTSNPTTNRALTLVGTSTFDVTDAANTFTIGSALTPGGILTKTGAGTLTLNGDVTSASNLVITGGVLNPIATVSTGAGTTSIGTSASTTGVLRLLTGADYSTTSVAIGNTAGGFGSLVIDGGSFTTTTATTSAGVIFGTAGSGGILIKNGGSLDTRRVETGTGTAATAVSSLRIEGGTLTATDYILFRNTNWEFTVTGGQVIHNTAGNNIALAYQGNADAFGAMTVAGGSVDNTGRNVTFGQVNTSAGLAKANLNLNGGTLTTNQILHYLNSAASTTSYVNFNGGTLKAATGTATFIGYTGTGGTGSMTAYVNGAFGSYAGGAVIDSNGFNIAIPIDMVAPTGDGVVSIPLTGGGGGYISAPVVQITGGGGTGASAYATVETDPASANYGKVTGIVVTNPGVNYTSAPTITLVGGNGTGYVIGTVTTAANTSGGLTKTGNGTLTLTGTNTYTGATTVNGGSLSMLPTALPNTSGFFIGAAGTGALDLYADGTGAALNLASGINITLGSATTSGALGFHLGTASDSIVFSGGELTINAGGGYIDGVALSGFGVGSYTVITGAASITGIGNLRLGTLPSGYQYSLSSTSSTVTLNVLNVSPAGDLYWTGAVNNSWGGLYGTNSNWATVPNGATDAGFAPGADNTVYFSATNASASPFTTTLDSPVSIKGLKIIDSGTGAVTIAPGVSGTLTIGSDGIEMESGVQTALTISAPVTMGAAQTWTITDPGTLLTISGILGGGVTMSDQGAPGTHIALTITGGGTVDFTNAGNTFTGDIRVDGATFVLNNLRDWGVPTSISTDSHTIILDNGATLRVTASLNPGATTTTSYNLLKIDSGGATIEVVGPAVTLTLDDLGQFYGSGNVTKTGTGVLLLGNAFAAAYTGTLMTVSEGELRLQNAQALGATGSQAAISLADGTTLRLRNNTGMAAVSTGVTVNGDVTVLSDRTSAGGGVTHNGGPLTVGTNTVTIAHGANFNADTTGSVTFGAVTLTGSPTFVLNNVNGTGKGTLTLGATALGANNITFQGDGNATFAGIISGDGGLIKENTGNLTMGAFAHEFTGGIQVTAGTLVGGNSVNTFGANSNVITLGDSSGSENATITTTNSFTYQQAINVAAGNTGIASIIAGTTTGSIIYSGAITLDNHDVVLGKTGTTGASQFTGGIAGTGNITIHNAATTGTIALASGAVNPVGSITHTSTATGTTTISADIGSNVTSVTQNSASSQLTLSGVNSFGGPLTVSAGTLLVTRQLALYNNTPASWTAPNIVVNGGATLALNVGGAGEFTTEDITTLLALGTGSGGFMDGSFARLDTANAGGSFTHTGAITDPNGGANALGLIKTGAGTLFLTGSNTYSGQTTITAGTLSGSIGGGNLLLNGGVYESSGSITRSLGTGDGQVRWAAGVNGGFSAQGGALTVTFAGAPSTLVWDGTANFVSGAGQLLFGSTTSDDVVTFTHDIDLNNTAAPVTRTVQVLDNTGSANDKTVFSGVLSNSNAAATLAKTGAGVLELTNANTYSGATTNATGTLILSGSNSSAGTTTLTSGILQLNSASNGGLASGLVTLTAGNLQALNEARSISNDVLLTAVTVSGTQDITINGTVTGNTGGSRTLTSSISGGTLTLNNVAINNDITAARVLTLAGNGATTINGLISNGNGDAFANGLTITNTGMTRLVNANTYTGTTTMTAGAGTVTITNNQAFGLGTALTLNSGTLQGDGSGTKTLSQNVTHATGTVAIGGDDKFIFSGSWTVSGGTRTLQVDSTGGVELTGGTLTLGETTNNRAQGFAGSGNIVVSSVIQNNAGAAAPAVSTLQFQYTGTGTLTLTGANTYTGLTTINNTLGTVELSGAGKLGTGNLTVNAGTLNILAGGVNQSAALLTMGGGAAGSLATINVGSGRELSVTGVTYSGTNVQTAVIGGLGTLNLGGAGITVTVARNPANEVDMSWEMAFLTGSGIFIKAGAGTLDIRGIGTNSFSGSYQVNAGSILGLDALNNNLILNGGVYEGNGTFTRALGTGNNEVQWLGTGGGGFAANGGTLSVTLAGAPDPLVWGGTPFFVPTGAPLIFGSVTADDVVTFTHNIDLNDTGSALTRTVNVLDNTGSANDKAVLSGVLSNSNASATLAKTGAGVLELTGANTYSGATTNATGTLILSGSNSSAGTTTLTSGTLQLNGASNGGLASGLVTLTAGNLQALNATRTISNDVLMTAVTVSGAQSLTINGELTGATGGNRTLTNNLDAGKVLTLGRVNLTNDTGTTARVFTIAGSGDTTISGIIANAPIGVTPGATPTLTISSTGLTIFQGANTYTGSTTLGTTAIAAGTLRVASGSNLSAAGLVVLSGTVDLLNGTQSITTLTMGNGPLGSIANVQLNGGSLTLGGTVTYTASSNSGTATITSGTLNLNATRTFTINNSTQTDEEMVVDAEIADGTASSGLTKGGTGTLVLNAVNSYTGVTTVSGGTLIVNGSIVSSVGATAFNGGEVILNYTGTNTDKLNPANALTMNSATATTVAIPTLTLNGSGAAPTSQTVNGLTLNAGSASIVLNHGTGQTVTLTLGTITRNVAGTLDFVFAAGSGIVQTSSANGNGTILGGWATVNSSKFATVSGGQIEAFDSTIANNVADWTAGGDFTDSTGYTGVLATPLPINSLLFTAANATSTANLGDLGNRLTITSGGLLVAPAVGTGLASITGGTLAGTGGAGAELIIHQGNTDSAFTIGSRLTGTTILTKAGEGTLVLSGLNSSRGDVNLNEGTLQLSGDYGVNYSTVVLKNASGVFLDINNGTERVGGLSGGGTIGGIVQIGSGTLITNTSRASQTFVGVLTGTGTLIKEGLNTQLLQGDSTGFTGDVIVNGGLLQLNGAVGRMNQAATITVNGAELLTDQDQSASQDRIGNSTVVTLNNTAATRGLWLRTTGQNATRADTIGTVTLGAGHNAIQATNNAAASGTSQLGDMVITNLLRGDNFATALVRGQALGAGTGARGRIRPQSLPLGAVGGGGAADSPTMTIIPYLIGAAGVSSTQTDANVALLTGDSFVTWVSAGEGLRPLNLTTEYTLNEAGYNGLSGVTANNVRFAANPAGTLTGGSKTINSLVLDSGTAALTITGGGADTLTLASGALLATTTTPANAISLGGFSSLLTGTSEYLTYVTNAASTLTISSPLTSTASLTKSGAGTLVLSDNTSTYNGGTWFNQGLIEISSLSATGSASALGTGGLNFFGGGLRWATGATFDPSVRTLTFGTGGGALDTNGNDVSIASSIGNGGAGGLTKAGAGILTLNAVVSYTGRTTVNAGTLTLGVSQALPTTMDLTLAGGTLAIGSFATTLSELVVSTATSTITGSAALAFTDNFRVDGGSRQLTVNNSGGTTFSGDLFTIAGTAATTLTLAGTGSTTINSQMVDGFAAGTLTITNTGTTTLAGANSYSGTTTMNAAAGILILSGSNVSTGATTLTTGRINFNSPSALASGLFTITAGTIDNITGASLTLTTNQATTLGGNFTFAGSDDLNLGSGIVNNSGSRTITLSGSGKTLTLGAMTNTLAGANTMTVNGAGNTLVVGSYALSNSATNYIDVIAGSANVTISGAVTNGGTSTASGLTYTGTGTLTLAGANTYAGATTVNNASGTVVLSGSNSSAGVTTLTTGTLKFNGTGANNGGMASGLFTITAGTIDNITGASLTLAGNNAVTLGGNFAFTGTNDLNLGTGAVANSGSRTITLSGSGKTLTLGAMTNTLAGANTMTVNGAGNTLVVGSYALSNSATNYIDVIAGSANVTISGAVTNGGTSTASGLTYTGTGTLTLAGANTYAGATTISGGVLQLGDGSTTGSLNTSSTITNNATLAFNRSNTLTQGTDFNGVISGSGQVKQIGTGTTVFAGASANTYSGLTTISAGTLDLNKTAGVNAIVGDGVSNSGVNDVLITGGTLRLLANEQLANSVTLGLTGGTFNVNGNTETIYALNNSGGTVIIGRGGRLTTTGLSTDFWSGGFNGPTAGSIQDSAHLVITGGTNIVHGNEQYVGPGAGGGVLNIGAGGLEFGNGTANLTISSDDAPGDQGMVVLGGDVSFTGASGTASITNGVRLQADGVTPVDGDVGATSGSLDLGGGTRTFAIADGTAATDMLIAAQITNGALTKTGAGTLTLTGTNTYTGLTLISAGRLQLGNGGLTGSLSPSSTITNNGTLTFNRSNAMVQGTDFATAGITGNGNVTQAGGGTTTLSGTNSYSGATTVNAGTLAVTGSLSGTTAVTVNSGGTLLLNSNANALNTNANVTVDGGGKVSMQGVSNNTGTLAAMLTLNSNSVLDFGTGSGNKLTFSSLGSLGGTTNIQIWNWSGTYYGVGPGDDNGSLSTQDRLLFTNTLADNGYTNGNLFSQISFYSDGGISLIGAGQAISFSGGGAQWEIVPVPEPATTALIGAVALCALIGYRERRRFVGIRARVVCK
jgi:autotransporter-associated beta strand protein